MAGPPPCPPPQQYGAMLPEEDCKRRQRRNSSELKKQEPQLQAQPQREMLSLKKEKEEEECCGDGAAQAAPPAEMRTIILKQKASGSWALGDVSSLLGSLSAESMKKAIAALIQGDVTAEVEAVWITAVVIAFLQIRFPGQKTNWDLVVKKAKRWVSKQSKVVNAKPEGFDFVAEATKFVQSN